LEAAAMPQAARRLLFLRHEAFNARERMRIERAQDRQSRRIWRLKHNQRVHI
jgi:hypothetical protein